MTKTQTSPSTEAADAALASDESTARSRWDFGTPILMTVTGIAVWIVALGSVDLGDTSDLGLISALPWWMALGPVVLILAFTWTLWKLPPSHMRTALLAFETLAFLMMLFGTGPILEPLTANHVAWRHVGIADAIRSHGIDGTVDAYFNWPGFFTMVAISVEAVGPLATVQAAAWTPVVLNGLYLVPVFLLAKWLVDSETTAWIAAWIFLLGNWVGQDYLSPQGLAFFGYLVIIFLLATSVAEDRRVRSESGSVDTDPAGTGIVTSKPLAIGLVLLVYGWIVVSHQLTPFAILLVVGALMIARRPIPWQLLAVMVLIQVAWFSFLAVDYLRGNLQDLVDQLGTIDQIAQSNISNRVAGSSAHIFVVRLRMLTVVVLTLGGFLGWFQGWRSASTMQRRRLTTVAVIGIAPFGLFALGPYGGEVALRAYLFALPVLAIFTAALLTNGSATATEGPTSRRGFFAATAAAAALVVLLAAFPFTKYGDENSSYFTLGELSVIEEFYEVAPPGSLVVSATSNLPWKSQGYREYEYRTLSRLSPLPANDELAGHIRNLATDYEDTGAYVVLTRSQGAFNDSYGVWEVGTIEQLISHLTAAEDFVVISDSGDGILFRYVR